MAAYLHQGPLCGDDVVWLPVFVDEPGVGLDPLPAVVLGEQSEDGEAALSCLNHCSHIRQPIRFPLYHLLRLNGHATVLLLVASTKTSSGILNPC